MRDEKEVAGRCYTQVGYKVYSRLGIVLQCIFEISFDLSISLVAFSLPSKVDSEVILMRPCAQLRLDYCDCLFFDDMLILCFSQC